MAAIELTTARERLALWMEADAAIAGAQEYRISGTGVDRTLTRADAAEVRNNIRYWSELVEKLERAASGGGRRARYVGRGY